MTLVGSARVFFVTSLACTVCSFAFACAKPDSRPLAQGGSGTTGAAAVGTGAAGLGGTPVAGGLGVGGPNVGGSGAGVAGGLGVGGSNVGGSGAGVAGGGGSGGVGLAGTLGVGGTSGIAGTVGVAGASGGSPCVQPDPVVNFAGPDFSFSGRNSQAEEPPWVTPMSHTYFDVTQFGAIPNDGLTDRVAIEAAIAAAEAHPGPAVVYFPAGRFVLRGPNEVNAEPIRIRGSQIVLKGAGMYTGGTELFVASESFNQFAMLFWPDRDPSVGWRGAELLTTLSVTPDRGQREIQVTDPSKLRPGDIVRLSGTLPNTWPEWRAFFQPLGDEAAIRFCFDRGSGGGKVWRSDFLATHEIESISGNTVRFKEPIQADFKFVSPTLEGGPKLMRIFALGEEFMHDVGVEDLAFVSNYRDHYWHFFNRASQGYQLLGLRDVRESWVRRVRMRGGTHGLFWLGNGKNNVTYDVLFEGNSGHYSMTTQGNFYGNQASFIREATAIHHGFGVTDSAFSTVYHRCNQFAGPEGHAGYPQASLYDMNEGNLSHHRFGGAPPHQSKFTVFWNWNQSWFIPKNSGVHANGDYTATSLEGNEVDFWPNKIMRPWVLGLHGTPLKVRDIATDLEVFESPGQPMSPQSLFEGQLRARLGAVPRWLCERSHSFEQITRYSQVEIDSPANDQRFPAGTPVNVGVGLHPKFDRQHLQRLELRAAPGHDLDFPELVVGQSADPNVQSIVWTPSAPGPWRFRLVLVNSLGEEFSSQPLYLFAEPAGVRPIFHRIANAWLQPRTLQNKPIYHASDMVPYNDPVSYHQAVRAIERPMVQPSVDDPGNRQVGASLIDGNLAGDATGPAGLGRGAVKALVFDLGANRRMDFVEFVAPAGPRGDYFGKFGVEVATLPGAQYSFTNSDFTWRTVRRMGHARMSARMRLDAKRSYRIHLPAGTEARYLRFIIHKIESKTPQDGNLSEVRIGSYPGL